MRVLRRAATTARAERLTALETYRFGPVLGATGRTNAIAAMAGEMEQERALAASRRGLRRRSLVVVRMFFRAVEAVPPPDSTLPPLPPPLLRRAPVSAAAGAIAAAVLVLAHVAGLLLSDLPGPLLVVVGTAVPVGSAAPALVAGRLLAVLAYVPDDPLPRVSGAAWWAVALLAGSCTVSAAVVTLYAQGVPAECGIPLLGFAPLVVSFIECLAADPVTRAARQRRRTALRGRRAHRRVQRRGIRALGRWSRAYSRLAARVAAIDAVGDRARAHARVVAHRQAARLGWRGPDDPDGTFPAPLRLPEPSRLDQELELPRWLLDTLAPDPDLAAAMAQLLSRGSRP